MWPSGPETPAIYSIQFLVINVLGIDLLLYPPVLRPALLKKRSFVIYIHDTGAKYGFTTNKT